MASARPGKAAVPDAAAGRLAHREHDERWVVAGLLMASLVLRLVVLERIRVNSDEPQHLHVVWAWTQGLLPYRDVFDNHMPLFHILSVPALVALGERPNVVLWMRLLMLPLWAMALLFTARIGSTLFGSRVGLWSTVVAGLCPGFFFCSLEYRPDVLWTVLWLAAIAVAVNGPATPRRGFAVGLLLGTAVAVSLKTIVMLLALGLAALATPAVAHHAGRPRRTVLQAGAAAAVGLLIAPGLVTLFFITRGALEPFLDATVWHNLTAGPEAGRGTRAAAVVAVLAIVPIAVAVVRRTPSAELGRKRAFVLLAAGGYAALLLGFWPIITRQDMLPAFPLLAIAVTAWLASPRISAARRSGMILPLVVVVEMALVVLNPNVYRAEAADASAFLGDILRLVPPGEAVLDPKGSTVFRPRAVFRVFDSITRAQIRRGLITDDFADELVRSRAHVVAGDLDYLPPAARRWARIHYLAVANYPSEGCVRVAGARFDPAHQTFDVGIPATYALVATGGTPQGLLDGRPYDGPRTLAAGLHTYRPTVDDDHVALLWAAAADQSFSPFDAAGNWR
jgi:hypothetical protein